MWPRGFRVMEGNLGLVQKTPIEFIFRLLFILIVSFIDRIFGRWVLDGIGVNRL